MQIEVDYWSYIESNRLRKQKAAANRDTEWTARLTPDTLPQRDGGRAQQRRHRCHHDGAEALEATLVNSLLGGHRLIALGVDGEIDDHDGIFFDDANKQDDTQERVEVEILSEEQQCEERTDGGCGKT